jgi:hypothetical protein
MEGPAEPCPCAAIGQALNYGRPVDAAMPRKKAVKKFKLIC